MGLNQQPWLLIEDFNTVFEYDHRINGNLVTQQELDDGWFDLSLELWSVLFMD